MGGKQLTENEKNIILSMHSEGYNTVQIGKCINRSDSTVGNMLRRNGLKANKNKVTIDSKSKQEIIKLYTEDFTSTEEISSIYGYTANTIANKLRSWGYEIRPRGNVPEKANYSFFENIDSEDKAYFLGLIIADGSVGVYKNNTSYSIRLELEEKDGYLIKKFAKLLGYSDERVRSYEREKNGKRLKTNYITIFSQKMFNDLSKYGVVPNKTYKCYIPQNIPEDLKKHLIRGIFDGDGYVSKTKNLFTLYGSEDVCNDFKEYVTSLRVKYKSKNNYDNMVFNKNETLSMITFGNIEDFNNFYNEVYKDSKVFMERKIDVFYKKVNHANAEVTREI